MSNFAQYNSKFNGVSWESMMQLLLLFEDSQCIAYSRPGKDNGIDAISGDGQTVYQAKFHAQCSIEDCVADLKREMSKIKGYRERLDYWKPVKKWILFTNIEENPNDNEKWNAAVKECDCCNLEIEIWNWPQIWKLLEKYPEVKQDFFENESRCFLLKNEFQTKSQEEYLPESFDVECVGREKELQLFKDFLESDRKIWCISGPGGMGKSRFLAECAKLVDCERWNVYFGVSDVLKITQSWNKRVVLERPSILFIDELGDVCLLNRIITDLTTGGMQNWKVVFSERNANARTILEIKQPRYDFIRMEPTILSRLNFENRRNLTSNLLNAVEKSRKIQFDDKDRATHGICEVSQGIPLWISLAIKLIVLQNGKLGRLFEDKATNIRKIYSESMGPSLSEIPLSNEQYEIVLKWSSLYRQVSFIQTNVVEFICTKADIDQTILLKTYQLMVDVGLMQRFGYEDKVYSICPDVIREGILKERLLFNQQLSNWGKSVVDGLITNEIPNIANVVESLSRVENNEDEIDVLGKFVESVAEKFKTEPLENHSRLWSVVEKMSSNRPDEILAIVDAQLNDCCFTESVDKYVKQDYFESVKNVLSVCLYNCDDFASKAKCLSLIFILYKQKAFSNRYVNALEDFLRPIFEGSLRDKYIEIVEDFLSGYFMQIRSKIFSQDDLPILKELLRGCFKVEYNSSAYYAGVISIGRGYFSISHISQFFKWINEIQRVLTEIDLNESLSSILIESYGQLFGGLLRYPKTNDNDESVINSFLSKNLQWVALFISGGYGLQSFKRNLVREHIWDWILKYSKESPLFEYADKCEKAYCVEKSDKEIVEYLHADYRDDDDKMADNLVQTRLLNKDIDEIVCFIEKLAYYDYQKDYKIRTIAVKFGELVTEDNHILLLSEKIAARCENKSFKEFYYGLLVGYFPKAKAAHNEIALIKIILNHGLNKEELLYRCISNSLIYSKQSYDLLVEYVDDKNTESFARTAANFTLYLGEMFFSEIDTLWINWAETVKIEYLEILIQNIQASARKWNSIPFIWNEKSANWLVDKIALIQDLGAFEHSLCYFEEMKSLFSSLKNIQWLLKIFEQRNKRGFYFDDRFSLSYFVKSTFNCDERNAYSEIIKIALCKDAPYRIESEIVKIDPENRCLGKIVVQEFISAQSDDEKLHFAGIAGYLKDDSPAWNEISAEVCKYAKKMPKKEKHQFWSALSWKGVEVYTCAYGYVPKKFYDDANHFRKMLEEETLPERKEYWQWKLDFAERLLKDEEQRAKELRGE